MIGQLILAAAGKVKGILRILRVTTGNVQAGPGAGVQGLPYAQPCRAVQVLLLPVYIATGIVSCTNASLCSL